MSEFNNTIITDKTYTDAFRAASTRLHECRSEFDNSLAIASSNPSAENIQKTVEFAERIIGATEDFLDLRAIINKLRNEEADANSE